MAYVAPTIRSVGDAVTAADYNIMANDVLQFAPMVQGVFTNEAARDAAITSPTEGMHAYLTAPTVPAVTGATAYLPTGVQTIYNGSVWVCVTPVAALQTGNMTVTSSTAANFLLSSVPLTMTLVTGTTALITVSGRGTFSSGAYVFVSMKSATIGPSADRAITFLAATASGILNGTWIFPGLTAGTNTFTLQGWTHNGTALSIDNISIAIQGIA